MKYDFMKVIKGRKLLSLMIVCGFAVCFAAPAPAQSEPDITTSLVGHWKLDETSGTIATDSSGSGNNGTMGGSLNAGADSIVGRVGGALDFNGSNDEINIGNPATLNNIFTNNPGTVSAWIYPRSINGTSNIGGLIVKDAPGGANGWDLLLRTGNKLEFFVDTDGTNINVISVAGAAPFNQWSHVAATWDGVSNGNGVKIYVNGQETAYSSVQAGSGNLVDDSAVDFYIGQSVENPPREFDGLIDDVRVYKRVLAPDDIAELYRSWDGNIDYNTDARVPEYFNGERWQAMGPGPYIPNAVYFDGTNDYLQTGSMSGMVDSDQITAGFWIKPELQDTDTTQVVFENTAGTFQISLDDEGTNNNIYSLYFVGLDSSYNNQALVGTAENLSAGEWYHVLFSANTSTGQAHLYLDDTSDVGFSDVQTGDIAIAGGPFAVGAAVGGGSAVFDGSLADLWLDVGTYIDFSVKANRRKFIDENAKPVSLGRSGSVPTGTSPELFLAGDTVSWHMNKGTGSGFTESGTLMDATTFPGSVGSDVTHGLVAWWKMDETSGNIADVIYGNDGVPSNGPSYAQTGQIDNAVDFDGNNDGFTVFHNGKLDDLNQITLSAWIKPNSAGQNNGGRIIDKSPVNNDFLWWIKDAADPIMRFDARRWGNDASWYTPAGSLTLGAWQHVVVTYDYGSLANDPLFYVNGKPVSVTENGAPSGALTSEPGELFIGNNDSFQRTFDGLIDDVRIYNRVLAQDEVKDLYEWSVLGGPSCINPARDISTILYNTDEQVMQFCEGENWQAMGPVPGNGSGGCSDPVRSEGHLIYNKDHAVMQYCDGDEWVSIGEEGSLAPTYGLVAYWRLDETSGNTIADSSGNGNVGTWSDGVDDNVGGETVSGKVSTALDFDGSNDSINAGSDASIDNLFAGGGTISAWIYPTGWGESSYGRITHKAAHVFYVDNSGYNGEDSTIRFAQHFSGTNAGWSALTGSITLNNWYNVAVVYNSDSITNDAQLYVNGQPVATVENSGPPSGTAASDAPNDLHIGNRNDTQRTFDGVIDDVRFYDRALSADEIEQLYNATR